MLFLVVQSLQIRSEVHHELFLKSKPSIEQISPVLYPMTYVVGVCP